MIFQKKILSIGFITFFLASGCSHLSEKSNEEAKSRATTAATANEAGASNFTEIRYTEGSATLSNNAKTSLRTIIDKAKHEGTIDEIIILSWADENYPSEKVKKLSREQRNLANQRNKNIQEYLKTMKDIDINSYNMAERPGALAKLFDTADNKLKGSMIRAGLTTTADKMDYSSKASHSVILIKTKQ